MRVPPRRKNLALCAALSLREMSCRGRSSPLFDPELSGADISGRAASINLFRCPERAATSVRGAAICASIRTAVSRRFYARDRPPVDFTVVTARFLFDARSLALAVKGGVYSKRPACAVRI